MKTKLLTLIVLLLTAILLGACGPSSEEIAAMTASAWTPTPKPTNTPLPTPTATPLPYDLTLKVTDTNGNLIAGALVVFSESGSSEPVMTDEAGRAVWTNLNGPNVSLKVTAQGYFKGEQGAALERGLNEVTVTLERDPFGLLPSETCGAGESLLYLDDFQDGEAQGWNFDQKNAAAHLVGPAPDAEANSVLTYDATKITYYGNDAYLGGNRNEVFGDGVWRMRFMVTRPTAPSFVWHGSGPLEFGGQQYFHGQYGFYLAGGISQIQLTRNLESGPNVVVPNPKLVDTVFKQTGMQWYQMELSTYQGHIQLWIDGVKLVDYTDETPLPPGNMGIWIGAFTDKSLTLLYFDDIRVCGLNAPFASTYVAP